MLFANDIYLSTRASVPRMWAMVYLMKLVSEMASHGLSYPLIVPLHSNRVPLGTMLIK
jgi:hypothetical protein